MMTPLLSLNMQQQVMKSLSLDCQVYSSVYFHSTQEEQNLPIYAHITITVLQQE